MFRLLTILLLFQLNLAYGQMQLPFPDTNAFWTQTRHIPADPGNPWGQAIEYSYQYFPYQKDSIEGKEYTQLYMWGVYDFLYLYEEPYWYSANHIGHYRIDSNRVYFRSDYAPGGIYEIQQSYYFQTNEIMLYDYNLLIGDTFQLNYYDQIILDSIDSIDIGGDYYRTFHFQLPQGLYMPYGYYWIEGIGSNLGFFSYFDFFEDQLYFNCFSEYEFQYNYYPNGESCILWGVEENESHFEVYPNPAENVLNIKNSTGNAIAGKITDCSGKEIIHFSTSLVQHPLDISTLTNGVYLLTLDNDTYRFIKK